ncbi:MAG: serine hydrolase [Bacteroidota bacterium]
MRLLLFFALILSGCTQQLPPTSQAVDGWTMAAPDEAGFNPALIAETITFIEEDEHADFSSLVVARNGALVVEQYFNGHGPDSLRDMRSAGKSITSALVGIAIEEGFLPGIDTPALPLFPTYSPVANDGADKQAITIKHLLTMTSGIDADADDDTSPGYESKMEVTPDWVRFVLDLPMARTPDTGWTYSSASSFLAGAAVEETSGLTLAAFAEQWLFGPLGIDDYYWAQTPSGRTVGQGNLYMRGRDMAKIGQLYLDGGRWQGRQVLPEAWVEASVGALYPVPWNGYDGYGYSWYTHTLEVDGRAFNYFFASGNGGNKIYVFPNEQMVVITQSAAYNTRYGQGRSFEILRRVLAAVV